MFYWAFGMMDICSCQKPLIWFGFVSFHEAVTSCAIKTRLKIQTDVAYGEQTFTIDLLGKLVIIFLYLLHGAPLDVIIPR